MSLEILNAHKKRLEREYGKMIGISFDRRALTLEFEKPAETVGGNHPARGLADALSAAVVLHTNVTRITLSNIGGRITPEIVAQFKAQHGLK